MENVSSRIPTPEELKEWLETTTLPPLVTLEDVGKTATIKDVSWVDTKYGRKLKILLDVDGEEKGLLLSKAFSKNLILQTGTYELEKWIGRKVTIIQVMTTIRGEVKERPMIQFVKE